MIIGICIYVCEYVCIETHKHTYMACLLQNDMNSTIKDLHYYKIKDTDNRTMKQGENDDQEKRWNRGIIL